jgi:hypothetical protein
MATSKYLGIFIQNLPLSRLTATNFGLIQRTSKFIGDWTLERFQGVFNFSVDSYYLF